MVTFKDVTAAKARINELINYTPVMTSRTLDSMIGGSVFMKCENFQRVGAFKFRGVTNTLLQLSSEEKARGVVTHSSGNHAQALALGSKLLGIHAVIVMPKNAPAVKVQATKGYGAEVVFCENSVQSRETTCRELMQTRGLTLIHPYDDDRIIAGAGTAALELVEQVGAVDVMVCPVGGGGLGSGTAIATKGACPQSEVFLVEPKMADDAARSFHDGRLYPSVYPETMADGLRTALCPRTFAIIREHVDDIVTVSEEEILNAVRFLWERMKLVVEPSGAVGLAGVLAKRVPTQSKRIGVILSGGNLDIQPLLSSLKK
jgi:threonine dehydratase